MSDFGWAFVLGVAAGLYLAAVLVQVAGLFRRRPRHPLLGHVIEVWDSRGFAAGGRVVRVEGNTLTVEGFQHLNWTALYKRRYQIDDGPRPTRVTVPPHPGDLPSAREGEFRLFDDRPQSEA